MILKDFNIEKILKLAVIHVDQITCIECCKYYSVPTTAICGHTLCHSCWRGRGTCPSCGLQIEKKALMLNLPVQSQKEHVYNFIQTFEDLFNVKLDDFLINIPAEKELEDPNKNVKAWLSSSENHFSAPVTDSQQSAQFQSMEQDLVQTVKHVTNDIQIHSEKANILKSIDVVHITPQQDDWDKIEEMPEVENNKQENPVGPMDMESFGFLMNDKVYSSCNPRRSSRKKESCVDDNIVSLEKSSDKNSHKTFNMDAENNSTKLTKNWNNVKRMKKEFSKLNKKNKNKLNISIEMCKKTQTNKGGFSKSPDVLYEIEDNTPTTKNNDNEVTKVNSKNKLTDIKESSNENNNPQMIDTKEDSISNNKSITNNTTKSTPEIKDSEKENHMEYTLKNNHYTVSEKEKHIQYTLNNNQHIIPKTYKQVDPPKVCFFKKGVLNKSIDKTINPNEIDLEQNNNSNKLTSNNDDIEISIKIGSMIANIYIKKKENDIQFKINSDCEIQTSLTNLVKEKENTSCSPHNITERQNINSKDNNDLIINEVASVITKVQNVEKFTPSKKNTASADTATVQCEITESIEKEFANTANAQFAEKTSAISQNESNANENLIKNLAQQTTKQLGSISEDIEFLNDIFDGESVKEANIQPLITSKNTPSTILKFTTKSNKTKSQKDKRDRDCTEIEDLPNNKKRKISHSDCIIDDNLKNKSQPTTEKDVMEQDSENMNYDAIMSQVFANIDADMGKLPSNSNKNKPLQNHKNKRLSENNEIEFSPKSNAINNKEVINEKYSENIFSLSKGGQDSEIFVTSNFKTFEDKENTKITFEKPYEELESMANISKTNKENNKQVSPTADLDIIELSTPVDDEDSDKSVVEETPQKTQSFTRNKNEVLVCNTQQLTTKAPKPTQCNMDTEDGINIISLSDTIGKSTKISENITVVETKRPTLETPLNITKFVDQIKHKSTPVARKSLNFMSQNDDDPEQTLCPSSFVAAKTTQEKEFLSKAFNQSLNSPTQGAVRRKASKLCIAGSCLTIDEQANLRLLCSQRKWTFVDKYIKELTHLVVGVDEENKSQRSVKYMCALAGAKWIVSYTWVERCLETNSVVDEEAFEALDGTGEPGPRRSRLAKQKLFRGITFYCMPPFSVLDIDTLKDILQWAGGCLVEEARAARAGDAPALLLAEPEHTQEDRFIYLAMELNVVPVNYEWVLNCLGSYTLGSIHELLLCPASLLPKATAKWPSELMSREYE
ncbi:unnamed protein product, partial [Brenthis ino]